MRGSALAGLERAVPPVRLAYGARVSLLGRAVNACVADQVRARAASFPAGDVLGHITEVCGPFPDRVPVDPPIAATGAVLRELGERGCNYRIRLRSPAAATQPE